jgi:1-acyl-sn-glycerol-3-phosphate acyltransferase
VIVLRSLLFVVFQFALTPPYAFLSVLTAPLTPLTRFYVISGWSRILLWVARPLLGIDFQVEGREHLPQTPSVILSKHQSAWETLAFQQIFPPQSQVLKRELLWIPFFGWGLALMSPIAIDRAKGRAALKQIARIGIQRLQQGFWVVIYPEGTRVRVGQQRKYQPGGAWLAAQANVPIVPVAHNAGLLWPKQTFLKRPGTITVRIGPAIFPEGRSAAELTALAEQWIEAQQTELCPCSNN